MKPWKVMKPNTITLDEAIKAFIKHRAKGVSRNIPYRALLHDGSLLNPILSIAQLGLGPDDMVEVHWSTESEGNGALERVHGRKASGASSWQKAGDRSTGGSPAASPITTAANPITTAASPITTAAAGTSTAAGSASTAAAAMTSATNIVPDAVKGMP